MFKKICIAALSVITMLVLPTSALSAAGEETSNVDICPGIDETKVDQVDILILLDNSKSLGSEKTGSDKERKRFDALQTLFESVSKGLKNPDGSGSRITVDVSLMAFAEKTRTIKLDNQIFDPVALANEVSDALPDKEQGSGTNFISALDEAAKFMESRQPASCKFLIWFTDGSFDFPNSGTPQENIELDKKKLEELKARTCNEESWPKRLRNSGVNTYVVLLGDLVAMRKLQPETIDPSLALMKQITGDQSTEELGDIAFCSGENPTAGGEIFSVASSDIAKLTPIFERIGKSVGGGQDIYCPTPEEIGFTTRGLPDLKFFKLISIVSLEMEALPMLSQIDVLTPEGSSQVSSDFFEVVETKSASLLDLKPIMGRSLGTGWKFALDTKKGFCIMAKFIDPPKVKITKSGDNPADVKSSDGILTSEETTRIGYQHDGKAITPDEIMRRIDEIDASFLKELTGQLVIEADPANPVFSNPLTIIPELDKPLPGIQCLKPFVFTPVNPQTSGDTPKDRNFLTSSCTVVTKGLPASSKLEINIDFLVSALKSAPGCDVIDANLIIDGQTRGGKYDVPVNVVQAVALNFEVGEKATLCNLQNVAGVQFVYGGDNIIQETASVTVFFDLKPPPDPWRVRIVTAAIVLLAILLSLMLLRLITSLLAVMPDNGKVYSYESLIEISMSSFGQVIVLINGEESSKFQPSGADLKLPKYQSSKSTLELQGITLERKLGNLFRPFADPKAKVAANDLVSYWQRAIGGGLSIPFRQAIIVSRPKDNVPSTTKVTAQLTVIISKTGADGGINGVRSLIQGQKLKDVCKDYRDRYLAGDAEKSGNTIPSPDNPNDGGRSSPGAAKPPPPRQPGSPPPSSKLSG